MIELSRRRFIRAGLIVAAAPMIVRAASLMPVRVIETAWRCKGCARSRGEDSLGFCVCLMREQLMPGLRNYWADGYATVPRQWSEVFARAA